MKKIVLFLLMIIILSINVSAATYLLRGSVLDDKTGSPLEFIAVKVLNTRFGGNTDGNGEFNIYVDSYKLYDIRISFVGYKAIEDSVYPNSKQKFYYLEINPAEMEPVTSIGKTPEEQPKTSSETKHEETPSGPEFPSVSIESTTYRDILKQKSWASYGTAPWKDNNKFREDTKKICSFGCDAAEYCEGDRSELLDNNGNPLYNNINIKSYCADSTRENPYGDECSGNGVIEYSCKNNKCVEENVKECSGVCKEGKCVEDELEKYRKIFENTEILNDNTKLIAFASEDTSPYILSFGKDMVGDKNIPSWDLIGPPKKNEIARLIRETKGKTTIWYTGEGARNVLGLGEGERETLPNGFKIPKDPNIAITFEEMSNYLYDRGNLKDVILILDTCYSYNFAENLYNDLKKKGVKEFPIFITASCENRSAPMSGEVEVAGEVEIVGLAYSIMKAYEGDSGPLLGKHIFEAERIAYYESFIPTDLTILLEIDNKLVDISSDICKNKRCGEIDTEIQKIVDNLIDEYNKKSFCPDSNSCPFSASKIAAEQANNKLTIDYYVFDIKDETIKNSFENKPDELLNPVLNKVKDFYAHIGDDYNLPSVDIEFVKKQGNEIDKSSLDKNHFALVFTSKKKLEEIYWEDPRTFISEIFGAILDLDGLEQVFITEGQKNSLDKETAIKEGYKVFLEQIIGMGDGGIAFAIPNNHITFIYSGQKILRDNEEFINFDAAVSAHEIGHLLLSGGHSDQFIGTGKGFAKAGLMYAFLDMGVTWTTGRAPPLEPDDTAFDCEQINKINDYFKGVCRTSLLEGQQCTDPNTFLGKIAATPVIGRMAKAAGIAEENCPKGSECKEGFCKILTVEDYLQEETIMQAMAVLLANDENLKEEDARMRMGKVLEFYISINKPKEDILYILNIERDWSFNIIEEIVGNIKKLDQSSSSSDILTAVGNLKKLYNEEYSLINNKIDSKHPLYDAIDPLINVEVKAGLGGNVLDKVYELFMYIISDIQDNNLNTAIMNKLIKILHENSNGENVLTTLYHLQYTNKLEFNSEHPLYNEIDFLMGFLESTYDYNVYAILTDIPRKSKIIEANNPMYNIIDDLIALFKKDYKEEIQSIAVLREVTKKLKSGSINSNHPMYEAIDPLINILLENKNIIIGARKPSNEAFLALKEIKSKLDKDSSVYFATKLNEYLEQDLDERVRGNIEELFYVAGELIKIDYDYPSINYKGVDYVIGGSHHINLDSKWYKDMIPEAVNYGIDPYFYIAFTILEFRGVSIENKQTYAPDPVSKQLGKRIGVDLDYTLYSGAGGTVYGDAEDSKVAYVSSVQNKINKLKEDYNIKFIEEPQTYYQARDPKSPLNQRSFILLQYNYNIIMNHLKNGKSLYYSIQTVHGLDKLPSVYIEGNYPNKEDIKIKGRELPLYGKSMAELMKILYNNPKIKALIPENAKTPLMDKVLQLK